MPEVPAGEVSIRNLTKCYGPLAAVRDLSFDVAPGEIFGLLGPNGAGKTTTLECLLGLRLPDAGTLTVAGIDVLAHPRRLHEFVGAQLQTASLQDKITPLEALTLAGSFHAAPVAANELLERFALTDKSRSPFDSLSGGQKQRLLLALAFVNHPRLIVLDEPTAGLDPQSRRELHGVISTLRAQNITVLLSTHLLDEAQHLCDRIGILHEGRLVAVASPADLIAEARTLPRITFITTQPSVPAAILGLPGVVDGERRPGGFSLRSDAVARTIPALISQLEREGNALLDLQIRQPTLEDVFIELTGTRWTTTPTEEIP